MILLYVIYAFSFSLWAAIRIARKYEEARENEQQVWVTVLDHNDTIIDGFWAWPQ